MAGDWIKWTKGLTRKPEILTTARLLKVDSYVAAVLWMLAWEWADEQTTDGWIPNVEPADVDNIVGRPGFAAAAGKVGWLAFQDGGLLLPTFERHNGQSAKRRALEAERKRKARQHEPK